MPHHSVEALHAHGVLKILILQQRQQGADRIRPANHRQVDAENDPQPLRFRKGVGNFSKADGGRGITDEVEGVKETHPGRLAFGVDAGDQRQAQHRDRVDQDERDQRRPHPPQRQEKCAFLDVGIHLFCMMVSAIRITIDTMLANSAPPESETTLAVVSGVSSAPTTWVP